MAIVYIALGSNQNNPIQQLHQALKQIKYHPDLKLLKISSFYQSKPVGGVAQSDFVNGVCCLETNLSPEELLLSIQAIELSQGRTREVRWGPRNIDLDILFYDQLEIQTANLTIPHLEVYNRAFTVIPLLEIIDSTFYQYDKLQNLKFDASQIIEKLPFVKPDSKAMKKIINQQDTSTRKLIALSAISSIIIVMLFAGFMYLLFMQMRN